jgi:autotransporter-associated beta strand protein
MHQGSGTLTLSKGVSGATFNLVLTGTGSGSESGPLTITSGTLTKNGTGTWTLAGTNAFTGNKTLNSGTLNINNASALGTIAGTFFINGGTIDNTSAGTITTLNYPQIWAGDFIFTGTQNLNLGTGTVSMGASRIVTTNGGVLTVGGIISGSTYSLTKAGNGALTLTAANTFTGGTTLNAGTLNINNASALGTVAGTFVINGGTINNTTAGAITTLNYPMTWGGNFAFTGTQNLNLGIGAVAFAASTQVTVTAGTLTVGGIISAASYNFTKAGAGILSLGSNMVTLNGLTISAGTLISTSGTMNLAGSFSSSGTFTHNSGTVIFNGSGAQTISGSPTPVFNNLTVSNTGIVTFNSAITVFRVTGCLERLTNIRCRQWLNSH